MSRKQKVFHFVVKVLIRIVLIVDNFIDNSIEADSIVDYNHKRKLKSLKKSVSDYINNYKFIETDILLDYYKTFTDLKKPIMNMVDLIDFGVNTSDDNKIFNNNVVAKQIKLSIEKSSISIVNMIYYFVTKYPFILNIRRYFKAVIIAVKFIRLMKNLSISMFDKDRPFSNDHRYIKEMIRILEKLYHYLVK